MHGSGLTVRKLRTRAVMVPLERPLRTAAGEIPAAPLVLIDVSTEEGVDGRAYVFAYTPMILKPLVDLIANCEALLVGKGVAPVERQRDFDSAFRLLGRQGLVGMAMSGIDMALWDVLARSRDMTVAALLGGEAAPQPAYDSYSLVDPSADRALIERTLARGFKAIKIKLGGGGRDLDVATVRGLRQVIGPDMRLMVDYNQTLTVTEAIARADRLAEFDIDWIEEPVPAEDLRGHAEVRAASPIPVQTGENWWFPQDMARAIAADACDLAMPDLMKIGGVTGWLRAMGQAEAASIPMSSHLFIEASAHVLAVTPTRHWLEYLDVAGALLEEPNLVENGMVTARGPGFGMAWDEAAVKRCLA
jgi:mandelate racemase